MFHNPGGNQDFGGRFGDGGFQVGGGGFGSPSGGVDKPKKFRFQNITPVTAAHIKQMSYDGSMFKLGDAEVSQVTVVGTIVGVEKSQTCTTYKVDDTTGVVMVKHWNSFDDEDPMESQGQTTFEEGTPVRVFAQVRSFQKSINLNALHVRLVEDLNEITVHMLECIKFKLVNEAKKLGRNTASFGGGGAGFNVTTNQGGESNAFNMGMDNTQAQVWKLIESSSDQAGMSLTEIRTTLKNLNNGQIRNALDFLSNEGHIYSTIDEEHFRSTS